MYVNIQGVWDDLEKLSRVAWDMRRTGLAFSREVADTHREALTAAIEKGRSTFRDLVPSASFSCGDVGIHGSLKRLFFDEFRCQPLAFSKLTGAPSLNSWALQQYRLGRGRGGDGEPAADAALVSDVAASVLSVRKPAKLLTTFIDSLPSEGDRVRPIFKPWGAITGRWSCAAPNVQQLPKGLRNLYVTNGAERFVCADFAGLELRIIAVLANDVPLLDAFASGVDVHRLNAADIFQKRPEDVTAEERNFGKRFVYGANYGAKAETLWDSLVVMFPKTQLWLVNRLLKIWFEKHPAIKQFHLRQLRGARDTHQIICPVGGRFEEFPDGKIDAAKVLNFDVQAVAAYLANRAIINMHQKVKADPTLGYISLQVHDEIGGISAHPERFGRALKECMEAPLQLCGRKWVFPVDLKVGTNWKDLEELHA